MFRPSRTTVLHRPFSLLFSVATRTLVILIMFFMWGCDYGQTERSVITEILAVRVEPNPVVVGDTATFTCMIEDTTLKGLEFSWNFEGPSLITHTGANQVEWVAPMEPGRYHHQVRVEKPRSSTRSTQEAFSLTVVLPDTL